MNIGIAVLAAILFFLSVLLHELAHSLVARARGLPVRRITLFFFGGVSNIEREPPSPGTEFFMAIVGPLTSFLLGVLFLWLGSQNLNGAATSLTQPLALIQTLTPLSTVLLWLGSVNILISIFNLIPGFPLDGDRILRSILWSLTDNFKRATLWATIAGQAVGWLMIIAGVAMVFGAALPIFGSGLVSGLWVAFIGWFLISAASQSYRQVVIEDLLEGVPVARLMQEATPVVPPDMPIGTLVNDYVMRTDNRAFPVVDQNRLLGVVFVNVIGDVNRDDWDNTPVSQIMVPETEVDMVRPNDDAMDAFRKMTQKEMRQIPVVQNNGSLIGMLRRKDILRWLQLHSETPASS